MKVVFDTNVLISALISNGKPRAFFQKAVSKQLSLVMSKPILTEFSQVADDHKIRKRVNQEDIIAFLEVIGKVAIVVKVKSRFKGVAKDPDDDVVLRTAFDGNANVIVSGDKHLLLLGTFKGIRICTVEQTLTLLNEKKMEK